MGKLKPNQFTLPSGAVITEHPILFSTEMVKANLEGRKTQTRRWFNQPSYLTNPTQRFKGMGYINGKSNQYAASIGSENFSTLFKSKYGKPGDLLWVKETHLILETNHLMDGNPFYYRSGFGSESEELRQDYIKAGFDYKWKPSIHLPKSGSRIWAMIEDIRVERVQDISEADCFSEGIIEKDSQNPGLKGKMYGTDSLKVYGISPKVGFKLLWVSINGQDSWDANHWVWVIKYRILSKTGRPSLDLIESNYLEITGKETFNV